MRNLKLIEYQGKYPLIMKDRLLGSDSDGNDHFEQRIFMYLGAVRLDVTDMTADAVRKAVRKLELMGLAS